MQTVPNLISVLLPQDLLKHSLIEPAPIHKSCDPFYLDRLLERHADRVEYGEGHSNFYFQGWILIIEHIDSDQFFLTTRCE